MSKCYLPCLSISVLLFCASAELHFFWSALAFFNFSLKFDFIGHHLRVRKIRLPARMFFHLHWESLCNLLLFTLTLFLPSRLWGLESWRFFVVCLLCAQFTVMIFCEHWSGSKIWWIIDVLDELIDAHFGGKCQAINVKRLKIFFLELNIVEIREIFLCEHGLELVLPRLVC